jgi:hypothetical protein
MSGSPRIMQERALQPSGLSSRLSRRAVEPERTQISYIAALSKATYAAFRKESRIKFANATKVHRNSGERSGEPALSEVEGDPAVSFLSIQLTAPNKSDHPPLVIPSSQLA